MGVNHFSLQLILISGLIQAHHCTTTNQTDDPLEEASTDSFPEPTTTEPISKDDFFEDFNLTAVLATHRPSPSLFDILAGDDGLVFGKNDAGLFIVNPENNTTVNPFSFFAGSNADRVFETNPTGAVLSTNVDEPRICCRYVFTKTFVYRCIPINCYPNRVNVDETTKYSSLDTTTAASQESTHSTTAEKPTISVYNLLNSSTLSQKATDEATTTKYLFNTNTASLESTANPPITTEPATTTKYLFNTNTASLESTTNPPITTEPATTNDDTLLDLLGNEDTSGYVISKPSPLEEEFSILFRKKGGVE